MLFTGDSEEEAALDEMEEVTHPNQLSDSEHMSHCMYVFKLTAPLCTTLCGWIKGKSRDTNVMYP